MQLLTELEYETLEFNYNRMRGCLQQIINCHNFRSELYTSDEDCAANLRDHAQHTLENLKDLPIGLF